MKKRKLAVLCAVLLGLMLFTGCIDKGEPYLQPDEGGGTGATEGIQASPEFYAEADMSVLQGKKIGITIQSLQNAYWAGVMTALQEALENAGAKVTIVACNDSSATQIGQIENFMSSKCDLIMVHPSDAAAIENTCKQARDAGVKVMCWDDPMTNTDANWILNNHDLGIEIGKLCGAFVNEHYTPENPAKVTVIGYPQTTILLEREEGILEGLEETASGNYEIVANQAAIDAVQAQTAMETILTKHPETRVVTGIGSGAMIGADEAMNIVTAGDIPDDMGVFTTDVTKQQLDQLADPTYPAKGIIGFEGSDEDTANSCAAMFAMVLSDSLESQNVFRGVMQITADNVDEIMAGMK